MGHWSETAEMVQKSRHDAVEVADTLAKMVQVLQTLLHAVFMEQVKVSEQGNDTIIV